MATQEKVDVAIVGAGPSGSIFADVLARAGKKVVYSNSGPTGTERSFVSSEIWGRRIKHAPRFQIAGRTIPATARTPAGAPAARCCTCSPTSRA